ncbi:N-acetyl-gamma-glutamyl-phosphate reductase [Paracoccus siganidrum]|uniref:N-acetyl-gamma-glutamyl-phosphate reductase n=1 Tax=Paracoccus siganidrum TaxID=1276757 RepID=A0A418ZUN6_9RHOB|nr:N-acetyl-gamma-glutamyl-phosphate reductase [Paracoccus siganidrum]RJL03925.1 N-acetyl-gamma-glutamyl-phosphate reductase [Paracoccus siganidrum]RMC36981.1 N-acetyl-gamma-glutamyl-phosphate reductase [Paracoccus siganidrum]
MEYSIFIDGEAGTTGLQIRERLESREEIRLIQVDPARRKDADARREAFAEADLAILCLPDEAAREAVELARGLDVRLIDASTAHRVDERWTFGFPELAADQRDRIASARLVSNPGCYSTGAIAMIAPLIAAGLVDEDEYLAINAVSGYSGGGKALIAEYEDGGAPDHFVYGLNQRHKHIPEIMVHTGLRVQPIFAPSVGNFAQGMAVQLPLHLDEQRTTAALFEALADHYAGQQFVEVVEAGEIGARIVPTDLNGTNMMRISVHGDDDNGCATVVAVLDNLGKGASGAAVQNLNIMLDLDEEAGL